MFSQESLKLFSVSGFSEIDSAQVFEVRFDILHDSAEPVPFFIECKEEINSSVFGKLSLGYF